MTPVYTKTPLNRICATFKTVSFFLGLGLFINQPAWSQGITIPSGSAINVNTGTLGISGDLDISGTLLLTTGEVNIDGNWDTNGAFIAGTGSVVFNGSSGTQTLDSNGTGSTELFNDLFHSGAGTLQLINNDLNIDGDFKNTAGTFDPNGQDMTVAEDWHNQGTFTPGTTTVVFDGTDQSIIGSTTFYQLQKVATTASTLTFDNTAEQIIQNSLTLQGADGSNLLTLNSDDDDGTPQQFDITLQAGGLQNLSFLAVKNSNAGGGLTLAAGTTSTDLGNNTNWTFSSSTVSWTGTVDTDWDTPGNWDLNFVPGAVDFASIPSTPANQPILSSDVNLVSLTIASGATVTLSGNNLSVAGTLSNEGNVIAQGDESVSIGIDDTDSGRFTFIGDNDGSADSFNLPNIAYYDLRINDTAATSDTFLTTTDLTVNGSLIVSDGAFDSATNANALTVQGTLLVDGGSVTTTASDVDVNDDFVVTSGVFVAPGSGSFTIAGDFTQSGGTFTNSSGTVTLDGTSQTVSADGTAFYSFVKNVTTADTLTFDSSIVVANAPTFSNNLTLSGTLGGVLSVESDSASTEAFIGLLTTGTQTLDYLEVRDMNADYSGTGLTLVARNSSEPNANNTNWIFGAVTLTWDGSVSTDWDEGSNWDLNVVPQAGDTAIVVPTSNDPLLTSDVDVAYLTVTGTASLTTSGNDLTISGSLTNTGNLILTGNETVSITETDTDSGTFTYVGDADGLAENLSLFDLDTDAGDIDYYDLIINDPNATTDDFVTSGDLVVSGSISILGGELDVSANVNDVSVTGTLLLNGGIFRSTNGNVDVDQDVVITTGTLIAPTAGQTFTVGRNWNLTAGTFTNSSGEVTLDTTTTGTITGDSTFYDLTFDTPGKRLIFTAGSNQTVTNDFTLTGSMSNEIELRSSVGGSSWNITFSNGAETAIYANVQDSNALTNVINCFSCTDNGNNNANWIFTVASITSPVAGSTTDTTPTIVGAAAPNQTLTFQDGSSNVIATTTSDANGNYRVEVSSANALSVGANTITPYVGASPGASVSITVASSPTSTQQPTITNPTNNERVTDQLPTVSGEGAANQAFIIQAKDADGNLLLQDVGAGTVAADGSYSTTLTASLPKGTNYLAVTVNNVTSDIVQIALVDPFGVVFDTDTNLPINEAVVSIYRSSDDQLAVPGVDLDVTDVNPLTTGTDGFYSFLTALGDYYITVDAAGYDYPSTLASFPSDRTIVLGSKGEVFTVAGTIIEMDHPMDSNGALLRITKDANKSEVRIGEVVTYTVTVENLSRSTATDVHILDSIPPGFKYLDGRTIYEGQPYTDPTGNRTLDFDLGSIAGSALVTLKYQLVVGAGVTQGRYENSAIAKRTSTNKILSNRATETVTVVYDPLFDLGTVIGKVFYDYNENGIQDEPQYSEMDREVLTEPTLPNIRLVLEDGTIVTTDKDGLFSLPSLLPGRHVLRLDERTLPDGLMLTTPKGVIFDVTPGLMVKVNFGVTFTKDGYLNEDQKYFAEKVQIIATDERPAPQLHTAMYPQEVPIYNDVFLMDVQFQNFVNYDAFIDKWRLEIRDQQTRKIIKTFRGSQADIRRPVYWNGRDDAGNLINLNKNYEFIIYAQGKHKRFDETAPQPIKMKTIEDATSYRKQFASDESIKDYENWYQRQSKQNTISLQNILIDGQVINIDPLQSDAQLIQFYKGDDVVTDINLLPQEKLTARSQIDDQKEPSRLKRGPIKVILPRGYYDVVVHDAKPQKTVKPLKNIPEGLQLPDPELAVEIVQKPVSVYKKPLKVGESKLFFVALGDGKAGYNFNSKNVEKVTRADSFKDGFYTEGKMSYYLKGKVLGKYLVTSSFDTQREQKKVFQRLDKNKYYPVYGDSSIVDYSATETEGPLFLLVEWDKSSAKWGNYDINFGDTEFARYSRSLYGAMLDYKSVSLTSYGDAKTEALVYYAQPERRSAHNEFLATGGSLYYLKHTDIIENSDKLKIEVRDQVTGLVISSQELENRADYEIDYESGRIVLWKPVPVLVEAFSIISSDLLDGNLVYLISDYEYEIKDELEESSVGTRVRQAITDNVLVGGTYVKDQQGEDAYELQGTDVTVRLGEDATIVAEFAETQAEAEGTFISTDGGLSFTEIATDTTARGMAYGIKADARLLNKFAVDAYYKWIENDFSSSATTAQQGKELIGFATTYDLGETTRITLRHDIQKLLDDGNLQTQVQVGAAESETTMLQILHEARRVKWVGEYRRRRGPGIEEDIIAARGDYELITDRLTLTLEQQVGLMDKNNLQTTLGLVAKPTERVTLKIKEVIGDKGLATQAGIKIDVTDRIALTGEYTLLDQKDADFETRSMMGVTAKINENTEITGAFGVKDIDGKQSSVMSVGGKSEMVKGVTVESQMTFDEKGMDQDTKFSLGKDFSLGENTVIEGRMDVAGIGEAPSTQYTIGGTTKDEDGSELKSEFKINDGQVDRTSEVSVAQKTQLDERTELENKIAMSESEKGAQTTSFSFGSKQQLSDELEFVMDRTFGTSSEKDAITSTYSLVKEKDGRRLEGSLARSYEESKNAVTQSNKFGLSGDIDDRWAFESSYERADIQNLDGSDTLRHVVSAALGFAKKDEDSGDVLKSSTKMEMRMDDGNKDRTQVLLSNTTEGNLTRELNLFSKLEYSRTFDETSDVLEAEHRHFEFGAAYRPLEFDRLNLISRYTYKENQGPVEQEDLADVEDEKAHIIAAEAIYDINDKWRFTEKLAYRIAEEKVTGFDFNKTHTWLMIHRLDYKFADNWMVGGEFRALTQKEADDQKRGALIEISRQFGDLAQMGIGYNFTEYDDDLSDLDYTSQGPFVRMTGSLYDRSQEEIDRSKQRWLDAKINRWAQRLIQNEVSQPNSPLLFELNEYYVLAERLAAQGQMEESRQVYRDIIVASRMMHQEAVEHIRSQIKKEDDLKRLKETADQYFRNGQYDKAREILEKILEDAESGMLE